MAHGLVARWPVPHLRESGCEDGHRSLGLAPDLRQHTRQTKRPETYSAPPDAIRDDTGQLSPDGRWLAYTSGESGTLQVYVQPFAPAFDKPLAGKWQISTTGGTQPSWRGDGKEVFYVAPDRKLMAVEVKATAQSFDRGAPQALFDSRSSIGSVDNASFGYVASADGKRFLMPVPPGALGETPPLTVMVNWLAGVKK